VSFNATILLLLKGFGCVRRINGVQSSFVDLSLKIMGWLACKPKKYFFYPL
jgi:hypothetical protein